jgi:transcriptional regulator GlxA family with amidase domain
VSVTPPILSSAGQPDEWPHRQYPLDSCHHGRVGYDVAVVAYPGVSAFGLGATAEVFGGLYDVAGLPKFGYRVAGIRRGEMRTDAGLRFRPDAGLDAVARADLAIVVCWSDQAKPAPAELVRALRATVERGGRVMSHCTGAFVLAQAGLLDGRRATTHWRDAARLAATYPAVKVDPRVRYIDEGPVITAAGTAAGIDACLYLIRSQFGARSARELARRMIVPPHRDGGQAQYQRGQPAPEPSDDGVGQAMAWALARLDEPLTVGQLARQASMSPRNFARRFTAVAGATPHAWLTSQRLLRAQELLEAGELTIDRVARACGLSAPALRHHFARMFGNSPSGYQRSFRLPG